MITLKIVITGSTGLLGRHMFAALHSYKKRLKSLSKKADVEIKTLNRSQFNNQVELENALADATHLIHFAGANRSIHEGLIMESNLDITTKLIHAYKNSGSQAFIINANSTQSRLENEYGSSKKKVSQLLSNNINKFCDIIIPNVFGESAKPYYNNVTSTFIDQIISAKKLTLNPTGSANLVHAGEVASKILELICGMNSSNSQSRSVEISGRSTSVVELSDQLHTFHDQYSKGIFPDLSDDFNLKLFNTYRYHLFSSSTSQVIKVNTDNRGHLVELQKGGGGGQSFFSTTTPNVTRGNHYHLNKVERFLVLRGSGTIYLRSIFDTKVISLKVSGSNPTAIDIPTLYTHSIKNNGNEDLLTYFWSHEIFDSDNPDTYPESVFSS